MHTTTRTPVPDRSLDQRLTALAEANRIRTRRAELKRELAAGRITLVDLFDDPDTATMKVYEAVRELPKYGRVKSNRVLNVCRISPSKTFGGLTARQRDELLDAVRRVSPLYRQTTTVRTSQA